MGNGGATGGVTGVLLAVLAASPGAAWAACTEGALSLRGAGATVQLSVEVADDAAERAKGLMNRASMPSSSGMLFVYPAPQRAAFWMKDTLIPLDMIFADETGRVTRVHENAVPLDETSIDGGDGVAAVLEINGGLARRLGIAPGTELRHPALDQAKAAWPCAE